MPVAPVQERHVVIGPETRKLAVRYFARFGDWPISLRLILGALPIPRDMVESGGRLRKLWEAEERIREMREKADGTDKTTLKIVVVSVYGQHVAREELFDEED
jgi:hypothetical protein